MYNRYGDLTKLDLSVRALTCLSRAGINSIKELNKKSEEDLIKIRNLGNVTRKEILEKLRKYNEEQAQPKTPMVMVLNDDLKFNIELNKEKVAEVLADNLEKLFDLDIFNNWVFRKLLTEKIEELLEKYQDKIIELAAQKAADAIQKKALPKLLEKLGG